MEYETNTFLSICHCPNTDSMYLPFLKRVHIYIFIDRTLDYSNKPTAIVIYKTVHCPCNQCPSILYILLTLHKSFSRIIAFFML